MKNMRLAVTFLMILAVASVGAGCAGKTGDAASVSTPPPKERTANAKPDTAAKTQTKKPAEDKTQTPGGDDDLAFLDEDDDAKVMQHSIPDPLEPINRAMCWFNDGLYQVVDPVAEVYRTIFPAEVRGLVGNFFYNLSTPVRFVSHVLQGEISDAGLEVGRLVINSTVGFFGFGDVATPLGVPKPSDEDMGQAFGSWGVNHGFYLVLPFFGPSSARDAVGTATGYFLDPLTYYPEDWKAQWGLKAGRIFNEAANILPSYFALKDSALDPYIAIRDFYTQMRADDLAE
jgi:phospholipid-binding lipoprotein MlaA